METEVKNRTWVKDAAIVFLSILLVLTFFSRTILNASLTEVAVQEVKQGTITAKVRGTGKVVANGSNKVKAKGTVTIAKVMVKTGAEVKTGDILFVLGAGDSAELETAKNTLLDLEASYNAAVASLPIGDNFATEQANIKARQRDIEAAQSRFDAAEAALKANPVQDQKELEELVKKRDTLENEINTLQKELDEFTKELDTKKETLDDAMERLNYLRSLLNSLSTSSPASPEPTDTAGGTTETTETTEQSENYAPSTGNESREELERQVKEAEDEVARLSAEYAALLNTNTAEINNRKNKIYEKQNDLAIVENQIKAWTGYNTSYTEYVEAKNALENAKDSFAAAQAELARSMALAGQTANSAYVAVQAAADKVERQKEKIKELSGEGDNNVIEAKTAGTVTEINCASGDTVAKDDILAVIEVADMGYTVSFSVTNDQARRLKVGDEATISNFYWGNEIKAKLKSIATDKENPQNKKVLTFDLEGNVTAGSELTVSVGQKSANYDLVVPNSAIRSDKNGKFVLAVEAKNSPLGNRYMAKRVKVEVLAEDDTNSAVTAELESGDFVITTSSAPIKSGEQVRLADSQS